MKELVKIQMNAEGKKAVSAREMYVSLGLDLKNWKRWANKNIEKNKWAEEGTDWVGFLLMTNGNKTKDYSLSIDFAKKLCMQARTDRGEEIRSYFIEVEKVAVQSFNQLDAVKLRELENKVRRLEAVAVRHNDEV